MFIIIILIILTGCAPESEPVSGAALDLQARFEDMFEDAEPVTADGTVRFGEEPVTEIVTDESYENETEAIDETEKDIISEEDESGESENEKSEEKSENEEKFVVTPSGRRYHIESCHHGRNVKEYLTREEAESKGYEPCQTCKP